MADIHKWALPSDWVALYSVLAKHLPERLGSDLTEIHTLKPPNITAITKVMDYGLPQIDDILLESFLAIKNCGITSAQEGTQKVTMNVLEQAVGHFARAYDPGDSSEAAEELLQQVYNLSNLTTSLLSFEVIV